MEKFESLFKSYKGLYTESSPLIICARALVKNNENGKVFVQLKFKNVSYKVIKAVKVLIKAFDSFGNEIERSEYQYIDISVKRNEEFGNKQLIELQNNTARSFSVICTEVLFEEGKSDLLDVNAEWKEIPEQKELEEKFGKDIAEQYRRDTFAEARYELDYFADIWRCACGAINKRGENKCNICKHSEGEFLKALNRETLAGNLAAFNKAEAEKAEKARIEAERKAEEQRIAAEKQKKKNKIIAAIVTPIVLIAIAVIVVFTTVIQPQNEYNAAVALMEEGKYEEAITAFEAMEEYKDSTEQIDKCYLLIMGEEKYNLWKNAKMGESITFGNYHGETEWIVLNKKGTQLLIISQNALDSKPYNTSRTNITWETCSLRKWLNSEFIEEAFSAEEQKMILTTKLSNPNNPDYDTKGGNDTEDKVFLLSIKEAEMYFTSNVKRQCKLSDYAKEKVQGVYFDDNGNCWWGLRSPGNGRDDVAYVTAGGRVFEIGNSVDSGGYVVRPAMWIDLSATE